MTATDLYSERCSVASDCCDGADDEITLPPKRAAEFMRERGFGAEVIDLLLRCTDIGGVILVGKNRLKIAEQQ